MRPHILTYMVSHTKPKGASIYQHDNLILPQILADILTILSPVLLGVLPGLVFLKELRVGLGIKVWYNAGTAEGTLSLHELLRAPMPPCLTPRPNLRISRCMDQECLIDPEKRFSLYLQAHGLMEHTAWFAVRGVKFTHTDLSPTRE